MKIDANVEQIRALLKFAERHGAEHEVGDPVPRGLPRGLVERYYALVDAGRVPAVAAIERGICSGCHIRLPTAVESQTRRVPALHTCPSCRRMLYVRELVDEPAPASGAGRA